MRLFWSSPARVQAAFYARLDRFPLGRHPGFFFNPQVEGYRDHVFGGRAGPSTHISHLFHELAHAAQFGPDAFKTRTCNGHFVFRNRLVTVLGQRCVEPLTWSSTKRELETFAYQFHLLRSTGLKTTEDVFFRDAVRSLRYMTDWHQVPGETEEAQEAHCLQTAMEYRERITERSALSRLEGWLDASAQYVRKTGALANLWDSRLERFQLGQRELICSSLPRAPFRPRPGREPLACRA